MKAGVMVVTCQIRVSTEDFTSSSAYFGICMTVIELSTARRLEREFLRENVNIENALCNGRSIACVIEHAK